MHFKKPDLQQLTPEYIEKLPPERLVTLVELLRQDLISARDALNQNSSNSSKLPSTRPPWERDTEKDKELSQENYQATDAQAQKEENNESSPKDSDPCNNRQNQESQSQNGEPKRKPGKQKGAQGFGRTQKLMVTEVLVYKPECCSGVGNRLEKRFSFNKWVDIAQLTSFHHRQGK